MHKILRHTPDFIEKLTPHDHALVTYSMFHNRIAATKLMLSLGFDPMSTGMDGGSLAHIAAWNGDVEIITTLLRNHRDQIDLEMRDHQHGSTVLGWAAHGSVHSHRKDGDHLSVVAMLIDAGAKLDTPANRLGTNMIDQAAGNPAVQQLLRERGAT